MRPALWIVVASLVLLWTPLAAGQGPGLLPRVYTTQAEGGTYRVEAEAFLRRGPGTRFPALETLQRGAEVEVEGLDAGWARLRREGRPAFVAAGSLARAAGAKPSLPATGLVAAGRYRVLDSASAEVRVGPGANYSRLGLLGAGAEITVTGGRFGWARFAYGGRTGYAQTELLVLAASAPPGSPATEAPRDVNARVRVLYQVAAHDPVERGLEGRHLAAQGITVELVRRSGPVEQILVRGVSDAEGWAALRYRAQPSQQLLLRVVSEGPYARVRPKTLVASVFSRPYLERVELGPELLAASAWSLELGRWNEGFDRALQIADVAHRTQDLARSEGLIEVERIDYLYPSSGSFTTSATRVEIGASAWFFDPDTIAHETAHTYWIRQIPRKNLRGGTHHLDGRASNPILALSEGWADAFGAWAGDRWGQQHGLRPDARFVTVPLESHYARTLGASEDFARWGEWSEVNVAAALWDLADGVEDSAGVVAGTDRIELGLGRTWALVRAGGDLDDLTLSRLWEAVLAPELGREHVQAREAGREALRMNGVEVGP